MFSVPLFITPALAGCGPMTLEPLSRRRPPSTGTGVVVCDGVALIAAQQPPARVTRSSTSESRRPRSGGCLLLLPALCRLLRRLRFSLLRHAALLAIE